MDAGLRGKTALITGGGSGIGRAIALALASEGVNIVIASRQPEDEALGEIEAFGVQAMHIQADVSDEAQVVGMVEQATAMLGHLDLYVNNAATTRHQPVTKITTDAWLTTLHTNLSACMWACREICRHMISRQQGSILIVGSTAQYTQAYKEAAYHISKMGLRVYKNTLALEMALFGVRVNLLVPGHYVTPLTAGIAEATEAILKSQIPLRRFGSPEELGAAAVLLLSDKLSPYTTGAEFTVDGGLHLRPLPIASDDEIRAMNLE
ncbi:MAG: SDR family oxidoreductase [Anaerolineae bacterium]|nr:SDR family oxidoreductase [Anaerolineae bacterium]